MTKRTKILEVVPLTCPCGATIDYENTQQGAINIRDFRRATGWFIIYDSRMSSIWLCPTCAAAALVRAKALVEILGSKYANLPSILAIGLKE